MQLRTDRQSGIAQALRGKDEEILRLRQQHKSELQTVINEMSSNTTETRVSDLMRKIQSQEATIVQLKVKDNKTTCLYLFFSIDFL